MKKSQNNNYIPSILKTVACENIVSEYELTQAQDKSLQDILNEQTSDTEKDQTDKINQNETKTEPTQ